jgi:transposase-like protein
MLGNNTLTKVNPEVLFCKFCGSSSVVKYGFSTKLRQRHLCITCNRTFMNNAAPERMRYPTEVIASAVNQFYEGWSLHAIKHHLEVHFNAIPDPSSIYDWVFNYTRKAIDMLKSIQPASSDTWLVSETEVKLKSIDPQTLWIWDCIDPKSGFLSSSHLTRSKGDVEAITFLENVSRCNNEQQPKRLIRYNFRYGIDALEEEYRTESLHQEEDSLSTGQPGPGIKLLYTALSGRTNIMSSLTNMESAYLVMMGWGIHYNYFHIRPGSGSTTPAAATGINLSLKSWSDIIGNNSQPV